MVAGPGDATRNVSLHAKRGAMATIVWSIRSPPSAVGGRIGRFRHARVLVVAPPCRPV